MTLSFCCITTSGVVYAFLSDWLLTFPIPLTPLTPPDPPNHPDLSNPPDPLFDWLQALEAAGIGTEKEHIDNVDKMRCGILVGTAMGGMATFAQAIEDLTQRVSLSHSHLSQLWLLILWFGACAVFPPLLKPLKP